MADILTNAPISTRRFAIPRIRLPWLAIGGAIGAMFGAVDDAIRMTYIEPYAGHHRKPRIVPDADLKGRDPDW